MAEKFTFFRSYIDAIEDMKPEDFKATILAICKYAFDGEESELTGGARVAYKLITPIIDKGSKLSETRSEAGKKGLEKRWKDSKAIANDSKSIAKDSKAIANDSGIGIGEGIGIGKGIGVGEGIGKGEGIDTTNVVCQSKIDAEMIFKWNSLQSIGITPIKQLTKKRKQYLKARLAEYGEDSFDEIISEIKDSPFLQGKHDGKAWQITFDWVILPNNYPKVLEGNYRGHEKKSEDDYLLKVIRGEA